MAISSQASGSQTAVISTEHTLATITTPDIGVFVLVVDCVNMVLGDILELRIKDKARSGDALGLAYYSVFSHAQEEVIKLSPPIPSIEECVFTLKQTAGTGRAFPWNIIKLSS